MNNGDEDSMKISYKLYRCLNISSRLQVFCILLGNNDILGFSMDWIHCSRWPVKSAGTPCVFILTYTYIYIYVLCVYMYISLYNDMIWYDMIWYCMLFFYCCIFHYIPQILYNYKCYRTIERLCMNLLLLFL